MSGRPAFDRMRGYVEPSVPASNVSEGLPTTGFAADRPTGPRTMKGHALASSLRRRLRKAAIDYDAWIRDIEAEAAALAHSAPEGLDVERLAKAICAESDPNPESEQPLWDLVSERGRDIYRQRAQRLAAEYARLSQPDATEEAGR